ncbi:MAG: serine/threonine protein kinase, partial [Polyangiales bacterium]
MADVEKSAAPESGAPAEQEETDTLVGTVIDGRFEILRRIARGGMGKVYLARQAPLGREVALKVLHPNYQGDHDPEFHKRFYLEASICAKLTHPNTVTIFDYGQTDDDVYFIAMEYLEGENLRHRLKRERPLPPKNAVKIAAQIARSLREAHSMGVVHRDLKPANIFLVPHDEDRDYVKVLDFGLVKDLAAADEDLTQTGLFMGSPKYMSPEQIQGEELDGRCDVYSLCVILYEMLTGKVPFHRNNSVNILMAHINEPPPTFGEANPEADIPPALEQVLMKGLSKTAGQRFAGMDELLGALEAAVEADNERLSWLSDSTTSGRRSDVKAASAAVSGDAEV